VDGLVGDLVLPGDLHNGLPPGADRGRGAAYRRGGFDRLFERADALLLGRRTWEIFERYWPHHDEGDPVSHGINVLPKYVPSTTLKDPTWQNTHVIESDVEAAVRELKAKPGRELQVHGSVPTVRERRAVRRS
jgi:dihydrofolate reductase